MKHKINVGNCMFAVLGVLLIGTGVAFNAMARLGNDPVGIFYDGVRNVLRMPQSRLGLASNVVNVCFAVFLSFFGRKYLNFGTLIYLLPYGSCVDFGTWIYQKIFAGVHLYQRILGSITGCFLIYMGIALYITVDIGMDPMSGMPLVIRDHMHWDYKTAKWLFDGTITIVGFLLGGKLGIITIMTAFTAGPCIQFLTGQLEKLKISFSQIFLK